MCLNFVQLMYSKLENLLSLVSPSSCLKSLPICLIFESKLVLNFLSLLMIKNGHIFWQEYHKIKPQNSDSITPEISRFTGQFLVYHLEAKNTSDQHQIWYTYFIICELESCQISAKDSHGKVTFQKHKVWLSTSSQIWKFLQLYF